MQQNHTAIKENWLYLFIAFAVFVNFSGLFIPVIGPDGTLYAVIAKTMAQRNDFVNLIAHGKDWLDKPHFPFWATAISFKLFGINTWAYKLPGILFLMLGAWYTFLFAKSLYNKPVALWSVLILLTAQHIVLSDNDVRAEPYLTGLIIAAVYHFYKAYIDNNFWHLVWGALFTACSIMTKGMFALVPIGGAIVGHLVITRQWKGLFNFRWPIAIVLVLIFILPEIWCLYQQFDIHPEKVVFGQTGVSGIKFFFWDSQFGRFFNTGPIKGHGDPSFFIHTTLWAFLPWSLLLFAAIFQFIKKGFRAPQSHEWYCICGSLLTFLLFSASKFQLPHYLNIVFPFFAIITAQYIYNLSTEKSIKTITTIQAVFIALLLIIILTLDHFFRPDTFGWFAKLMILALYFIMVFLPKITGASNSGKIILRTALISFIVNVYLNFAFYPSLMHYQASSEAAVWINQHNPKNLPVAMPDDDYISAFEFYSEHPVTITTSDKESDFPTKPYLLYASADEIDRLSAKGFHITPLQTYQRYWVSRLKPAFLNKATREKELTTTVVALVN